VRWGAIKSTVLVRKGGLEPPCPCGRSHLKAVRLPISPLPLVVKYSLEPTSSNSYLKLISRILQGFIASQVVDLSPWTVPSRSAPVPPVRSK
jgi:hypothetical protein